MIPALSQRWLGVTVLCSAALLAAGSCRHAPVNEGFDGTWVMSVEQRVLMVLTLEKKGDEFVGTLDRPGKMTTDGYSFSGLGGGVVTQPVVKGTRQNGAIHLVIENPKDRADRTEFEMSLTTRDTAAIKLAGSPFDAWPFRRHPGGIPVVATDWDAARSYALQNQSSPPNAEMRAILAEDQAARQGTNISADRWQLINRDDAARRERTRRLLERGELQAPEDFRSAAFVFQHGNTPEDYLLAHTLALIALAKGDRTAGWIAAASLDRYLQSIRKSQIYGTQFRSGTTPDQEPYDRKLISDALRRQLNVPALADQEEQFRKLHR